MPGQYSRPSGHIPFTPRAKKVLELSLSEAKLLGHRYVGTEHILLGLLREGEGVAAQVLAALGADLDGVRERVIQLLAEYQARKANPGPAAAPVSPAGGNRPGDGATGPSGGKEEGPARGPGGPGWRSPETWVSSGGT